MMRRIIFFTLLFAPAFIQAQIDSINLLQPAAVKAVTSDERAPFAHTDLTADDLKARDTSQDLPFLLRFAPSVVVTSDAGNGIGYTGMRIRGIDATRVNVTINGVPLNDAESQGVYWVDLPDLGSSVTNLQIHRGVGTSTVGPSAFGGSVAINTLGKLATPNVSAVLGAGSFGSRRMTAAWSTGMVGNGWSFDGRASQINSDGYVDRATSELFSLYGSATKRWETGRVSFTQMNGAERTYQSWFGVPQLATDEATTDEDIWSWAAGSYEYGSSYDDSTFTFSPEDSSRINNLIENRRRHNYYTYANEVDDYTQNHSQLHLDQSVGKASVGLTLYQTLGKGFYEQQKLGDGYESYGLVSPDTAIQTSDVIRRRWLDNTLQGGILNVSIPLGSVTIDAGGAYSQYEGGHYGEIIEMENVAAGHRYYDNLGNKTDMSAYTRATLAVLDDKLRFQGEIQLRSVEYSSIGIDSDLRDFAIGDTLSFFNPKLGLDYMPDANNRAFASIAKAHREPSRSDYFDNPQTTEILPEHLLDFEFGFRHSHEKWAVEIGAYMMQYHNQLIATGALNDVGNPIRVNVEESYRRGIELQAGVQVTSKIRWDGNLTLSENKIPVFTETVYDYAAFDDTTFNYVNTIEHLDTDIAFSPSVVGSSVIGINIFDGTSFFSNEALKIDIEFATKYVGKQYLDNTSNDDRSLPAYLVNDVILRCSTSNAAGKEFGLSLFANNILNHMYSANGWTYSFRDGGADATTTENYVYPQAGRNGFVSLSVKF
jgi:iron complex outermembrane receptor protein